MLRQITSALSVAMALCCSAASGQTPSSRFVTLGTGGGPVVQADQAQPSNAVVVGDAIYLFDTGDGVLRQLARANLPLRNVRAVFISHFHVDHVAGLGPVLANRFVTGATSPLATYGPPGLSRMLDDLTRTYAPIENASHVRGRFADTVNAHDLPLMDSPTVVFEDENIRVLAMRVDHFRSSPGLPEYPEEPHAYAFRIETASRTFVFSGDTGPSEGLTELARNADVLVTEVVVPDAIGAALRRLPGMSEEGAEAIVEGMRRNHLTPAEIGRIAAAARVRSVVITHQVPGPKDVASLDAYRDGIAPTYRGPVSIARDLDEF